MDQTKQILLTQGEVLQILAIRSERKAPDIAKGLGISHYTYLSKLYRMESLKPDLLEKASRFFGVHPAVFETPESFEELRTAIDDNRRRIELLDLENNALKTQVALCNARLDECERKKRILEANKN